MSKANPRYHRNNPPLPAVGTQNTIVLYRIIGQLEGQMTISTFMFSAGVSSVTTGQLTTLLSAIQTGIFPNYSACLSIDWGGNNKETLDVVNRNDIQGVLSTANGGAFGTRSAGHVPTEVAAVCIRYTPFKGQHGRGRVSLPGLAQADVTNSIISSAVLVSKISALTSSTLAAYSDGTNTWHHCIGQRSTTSPKLVVGFGLVTNYVNKVLLGTIRRRKIGRGK